MYALTSDLGDRPIARCNVLGAVPFSEDHDFLNRPYLTESHRKTLELVRMWMTAAGMSVRLDPLGNLLGRYEGTQANAPALLIGSHIDTVRNGGRYDGALGVMLGIETVEALSSVGRRMPFAIEVIAFGDEEGSRFPASMLCSRGIVGGIGEEALALEDADGVSLRQALLDFGLDPTDIAKAARRPGEVLAYVEAHIEQGPVLEARDLAIGVVTGIAAQLRLKARFIGEAGHAGTSPMGLRTDAIAAAAAGVLAVEQICAAGAPDLRGTVGRFLPKTAAYNVIAGEVEMGVDLRASNRPVRDAAAEQIKTRLAQIARERGVALEFTVVQDLPDTPCDPRLVRVMTEAVEAVGVAPFQLVSGAGHDAMAVSGLAPVAMLFIRCERGISHNADEAVAAADVALATRALVAFVEKLALENAVETT
ncbi:MAG: amidase, hydantoinase/carbamoylase family [Caulobacteraceae bacterium]|jgi:allantoate deiminase|nr:amidase, hydantoinase/carbamoylase family [Caulobacteraceae bacterium]